MDKKNKTGTPKSLAGFKSQQMQTDSARLARLETQSFWTLLLVATSLLVSAVILCLIATKGITSPSTSASGNWIKCQMENYIGYEVRSDWEAGGIDNAVVFQTSGTTAISVSCENLSSINDSGGTLCTNDTLEQFMDEQFATVNSESEITVSKISCDSTIVMKDTKALKYVTSQKQAIDGVTATTYTTAYVFLYNDYLCSVSFTSSLSGYVSEDFEHVINSLYVIPEDERAVLQPNKNVADTLVSGYSDLGSSLQTDTDSSSNQE